MKLKYNGQHKERLELIYPGTIFSISYDVSEKNANIFLATDIGRGDDIVQAINLSTGKLQSFNKNAEVYGFTDESDIVIHLLTM